MSLYGLPGRVIDRILGVGGTPVPDWTTELPDTNGHADFADTPVWARNGLTRSVVIGGARLEADADTVSAADFGRFAARFRAAMRDEELAAPYANCDAAELRRVAGRLRARIKVLGRQYGRASRTIGEQRGTIASLRAQLAAVSTIEAPKDWHDEPLPEWEWDETPGAPMSGVATGKPGRADGDGHEGGRDAAEGRSEPLGGTADADALNVGDRTPDGWLDHGGEPCMSASKSSYLCTRRQSHRGQHVATAGIHVCDVWPNESDAARERWADDQREDLAKVLHRWGTIGLTSDWDRTSERTRKFWRAGADAVVAAGWLPPREAFDQHVDRVGGDLAALGLLRPPRSVVVQVLTDHELLADDTCRCGWGGHGKNVGPCPPVCADGPLWHAEHVAAQLAEVLR